MTVLFCVDGGNEIGAGHLVRCSNLAKEVAGLGIKANFLVGGGLIDERIVGDFEIEIVPNAQYIAQKMDLVAGMVMRHSVQMVIFDVVHKFTHKNIDSFMNGLESLTHISKVGLLDSFGTGSLRQINPFPKMDLIIAPYAGEDDVSKKRCRPYMLLGPRYFVIDSVYKKFAKKNIHNVVSRVLVTCGGGDPLGISLKICKALECVHQKFLDVRVIVGPYYSVRIVRDLDRMVSRSAHNIILVHSPDGLAKWMEWCDIAIATSGLTKYELAAAGVPSILLSVDEVHDVANKVFVTEGTAIDLGIAGLISVCDLTKNIDELMCSIQIRQSLSNHGRCLVDGLGAAKIVGKIMELCDA